MKSSEHRHIVSVSPLVLVTVAAFLILGHGMTLLAYAVVLIVHEFAHAAVAEKLGYELRSVRIMPYGIAINGDFDGVYPAHEIAIAVAGPLANLLMWILLAGSWWMFPQTYAATEYLAEACLFTALINLLPVYPLDGGRIFRGVLSLRLRPRTVAVTVRIVSIALGAALVAGCVALMVTGVNFSYATLGIFVAASLCLPSGMGGYERIYSTACRAKQLGRGLPTRDVMVSGEVTALALYKMLRPDLYTRFLICDGDMDVLACVTESDLIRSAGEFNLNEKAYFVAKRLLKCYNKNDAYR